MSDKGDVGSGHRHRVVYREEKLYVTILPDVRELFFSSVLENNKKAEKLLSGELNMISRMITLAWQSNNVEKLIEQLDRSSGVTYDLPGILSSLIRKEAECSTPE